jgi:hypothetical protein
MAKTVDVLIEKSKGLSKGLRKHLQNGGNGVTIREIDEFEKQLEALAKAYAECDLIRAELAPKVRHANELMAQVKAVYADKKKMLKLRYPQEQWAAYGVPDKR